MPVRPLYLGAAAAAALLLVVGVVVTADRRDARPGSTGAGATRTPDVTGQSGTAALQEPGPDTLPQATEQPSGFVTSSTAAAGDPNLIVFGLFSKGRMVAVTMGTLLRTVANPNPNGFPANAASGVTGSAAATARVGDAVVVAATDQAQLVRLTHDFKQRDVLTVSDAIGSGKATILYGSLVPLGGDDLAVTLAFGSKVAALRVNVRSWQIVVSKVYDDRFAGAPQGCLGPAGQLVMVTTGHVDYLDAATMERRRSATLDGTPIGAACVGQSVVVTNFDQGSGFILDADARVVRRFTYEGQGTSNVIPAPRLGAVFLTEPDTGRVIRCAIPAGRCVSGDRVGRKPTDLALIGDRLVVAVENDHALAVVDARTLRLIGTASIPDTPRTILAYGT